MASTKTKKNTKKTSTKKVTPKKKTTTKKSPKKVEKKPNFFQEYYKYIIIILIMVIAVPCAIYYSKETKVQNEIPVNTAEIITVEPEPEKPQEKIDIKIAEDIDLAAARKKYNNQDIIGRLEIPDLFNILVVKGSDNKFYLNHSLKRTKDNKGTEFLDYRNNPSDKQINIYGHNSRTYNIPFRKLEKFLKKDFFDKNEYIVFQSDTEKRIYRIFSIKADNENYEHMKINKTGQDFIEHINILKENSINEREVDFNENSNLLILQTCTYGHRGTYYVISAIEVANYKYE